MTKVMGFQIAFVVIVMMYWARSDRYGYDTLAPWLHRRGMAKTLGEPTWLTEAWLPEVEDDFAVITFDYRGFGESEVNVGSPEDWRKDSLVALNYAAQLPDVDSSNIIAVGASLGADGAVDGFYDFNLEHANESSKCVGAYALSPVHYLEANFGEFSAKLIDQDVLVYALAGELVGFSASVVRDAESLVQEKAEMPENFDMYMLDGEAHHGLEIFDPELEQDAAKLLLQFIEELFPNK